jgi:hypothetical protein
MSGLHPAQRLVLCVRDDDARTFAFHSATRDGAITDLVAHAIARGRRLRCRRLAGDDQDREREARYLMSKGYRLAPKIL